MLEKLRPGSQTLSGVHVFKHRQVGRGEPVLRCVCGEVPTDAELTLWDAADAGHRAEQRMAAAWRVERSQ